MTNPNNSPTIASGSPRIALTGLWIGLWLGAIGTSSWGLWYVCTHPWLPTPEWTPLAFWFYMIFAPLILLFFRLWKWIATLCLLALMGHQMHHLDKTERLVFLGLAAYSAHQNQDKLERYGEWLTRSPEAPEPLTQGGRIALLACVVCGIVFWCVAVSCVYPKNGTSYSQNTLLIHNGCVPSTQIS